MKLKSFLFALGLVFINTCIYAQGKNFLSALEKAFTRKSVSIIHTNPKISHPTEIIPGGATVPVDKIPNQRSTVLGNISNGTFILDPQADTQKVTSRRPRFQGDWLTWENKLSAKLVNEFIKSNSILFRGISINNLAELENLLRNGSQIDKTHYRKIYFSSELSDAIYHVIYHVRFSKRIPILVTKNHHTILSYWNSFDTDIPAKKQEVFAYLYHNGKYDWYHVSLTKQGKIITQLLSVYFKEQKAAKPDTNNKADLTTNPSEYTSINP